MNPNSLAFWTAVAGATGLATVAGPPLAGHGWGIRKPNHHGARSGTTPQAALPWQPTGVPGTPLPLVPTWARAHATRPPRHVS